MNAETRIAHPPHEKLSLVVGKQDGFPDRGFHVGVCEVHLFVPSAFGRRQRSNQILDPWDQDLPLRRHEFAEERDEVRHRFMYDSPENATVQICHRPSDRDLEVCKASQTIG